MVDEDKKLSSLTIWGHLSLFRLKNSYFVAIICSIPFGEAY